MTSILDEPSGFERLSHALHELDEELADKEKIPVIAPEEIYRSPRKVLEPSEAGEAAREEVLLTEACGNIAADEIHLYPPGIPVIVPGEQLDAQLVETIERCLAQGLEVEGLSEQMRINIVKM